MFMKKIETNKNKLFLEFNEYKDKSVGEFIDILKEETLGIPLDELRIKDLTYSPNEGEIKTTHGVYIFKDKHKKEIILVGKARTVSFTERIGGHFDLRPNAWFNRLLFVIAREEGLDRETASEDTKCDFYRKAWKYVFENCSLILVNMEPNELIDKFETVLRSTAQPLNKFKKKVGDTNKKLKEI